MDDKTHELAVLKAQAKIRLEELKAQDSAKEVAGKAIGEDGLLYIFLIVLVGVGASLFGTVALISNISNAYSNAFGAMFGGF